MLTKLFKDATFMLLLVYRFGQCLGDSLSPLSTFFSLVSSLASRDAPLSRLSATIPTNAYLTF